MHCASWCSLTDEQLAQRDIAEVNLAAAFGLPHAGRLDIPALRSKLDEWADLVHVATKKGFRRRRTTIGYHSEYTDSQFRILTMITVLQRDLGVRYNLAFSEGPYDGTDSRNLFIHGLLSGHGGTCNTMPVLYAAIGRRLGYPIKLAFAVEHVFCRWDDGRGERFDIEATCQGFLALPDDHFLTSPKPAPAEWVKRGWLLKSLTPREELAFFMNLRGTCCREHLRTNLAAEAYSHASRLVPDYAPYNRAWGLAIVLGRARAAMVQQTPEDARACVLRIPAPKEEWERDMYPFAYQELMRILSNRTAKRTAAATKEVFNQLADT